MNLRLHRIFACLLLICTLLTMLPMSAYAAISASSVRVNWEVAAVDPVSVSYFTHAATGVVNGHDYLYLATRGGKFVVYDIDAKKQIDDVMTNTDTPRNIMVDENGIVWVTGGTELLRYDPFARKGELIKFSGISGVDSACGIVSDGKGKLYFGTMNHGYVGCYNTATKKFSLISDWLSIDGHAKDAKHSGYGGLVYKDGYLYFGIDGDMNADGKYVHAIVKFDIANRKIVDSLDIAQCFNGRQYLDYTSLAGDILFCSFTGAPNKSIFIDISGSKMKFTDLPGLSYHMSAVTEELNGKCYFSGYTSSGRGIVEYDVAAKSSKMLLKTSTGFRLKGNNFVTVEGDSRLPGQSVVIPYNDEDAGVINLMFWNPQTNKTVDFQAKIGQTGGTGSNLISMTTDPTGQYIYLGAYGNTTVAKYGVKEGKVVDTFKTYSHQTDGLLFYDGYLYAGNYSAGTITQINPQTNASKPLFTLRYSVFEQCRMHALTAGENKVFCGTTPYSGYGGVLVWYDLDKKLTYVAAGPNPEDVYYADTSGLTASTDVQKVQYAWYNAVTGKKADFDDNNDGKDDVYLPNGTRRFSGVIKDQILNNIIYKDGYIYGTSSIYGASGADAAPGAQAQIFVYDVKAMKVVATCDLSKHLKFLTKQIPIIDQLAPDPEVGGKFWGGVSDTLFSMTFDPKTKTFTVKEELSIKKEQNYSAPGSYRGHRNIIFNGDYIYVGFGRHTGTYMVRKDNPKEYYKINDFSPNSMVIGADGNLYWISNETSKNPNNLKMFPIGKAVPYQPPTTTPTTPKPTTPQPTTPQPTVPQPTTPQPTTPQPTTPGATEPSAGVTTPTTPGGTIPQPTTPGATDAPTTPDSQPATQPAGTTPSENAGSKGGNFLLTAILAAVAAAIVGVAVGAAIFLIQKKRAK